MQQEKDIKIYLCKLADAFRELFGGHGILVELPSERFLIVDLLLEVHGDSGFFGESGREFTRGGFEFLKQSRRDGQVIATGEFFDFTHVSEGGTHDDGVVVEFFVVVVDFGDGDDTWVGFGVVVLACVFLVPIQDSSDERRDEGDLSISASDSLTTYITKKIRAKRKMMNASRYERKDGT